MGLLLEQMFSGDNIDMLFSFENYKKFVPFSFLDQWFERDSMFSEIGIVLYNCRKNFFAMKWYSQHSSHLPLVFCVSFRWWGAKEGTDGGNPHCSMNLLASHASELQILRRTFRSVVSSVLNSLKDDCYQVIRSRNFILCQVYLSSQF